MIYLGSDVLDGGDGADVLFGAVIPGVNPGENDIDILTGGGDRDVFALGNRDNEQVFYAHSGNNDTGIYFTKDGADDLTAVVENAIDLDSNDFYELG